MPRNRPPTTGYERLEQADHSSDDSDDDIMVNSFASLQPPAAPRGNQTTQPRPHSGMTSPHRYGARSGGAKVRNQRRGRSNSGIDVGALNARLERWTAEIKGKFKRGKRDRHGEDDERLEIHHSVFQAPEGVRPATAQTLAIPQEGVMTSNEFDVIVESVRVAIEQGVHPRMITQGSSGSYFARNPDGKVVGVFKPKDEEPYAAGNPKWNKWIHRNLFPCCFGRACLIPNLSYVSEAAAYTLDCQLRTHMVPYTDVVWLSSKSFHYPFWDRYNYSRNRKSLPEKPGSFQVFLKGFKDANIFLREHPWPDQYLSGYRTSDAHRNKRKRWGDSCRAITGAVQDDGNDEDGYETPDSIPGPGNFVWTQTLKQAFREELEKLVILDYIMRNTDRGLDNWMIKVDWQTQEVSIVSEPVQLNTDTREPEEGPRPVDLSQRKQQDRSSYPYKVQKPMNATSPGDRPRDPKITIGAIDNSLSWPWKHPDAWRSFPFGWLFLPVDLIGRPFSQKTRDHFLPLLTSTTWWSQTQHALRKIFQVDPDFQEKMFSRQMAVMKGQAWNVVETLKTPDHGPLELTRRAKVCVWDDLVDVPVAVPMRATSSEMRRHAEEEYQKGIEEEMDIGAANSTSPSAAADLLGLASPANQMPNAGRFELSNNASDIAAPENSTFDDPLGINSSNHHTNNHLTTSSPSLAIRDRPKMPRSSAGGASFPGPYRSSQMLNITTPQRERRYSYATAIGRRNSHTIAQQLHGHGGSQRQDDDDIEGDLGYAAAEGMEGNQRKVIVERLEPVKARNPVFTWC
ncbi:phosphatidylinositol 3 and 4-kinase-domain-containing protein [Coniella lustricola]|uniref:Phosphatidylinositol 4-kinase n=1 Tax=Coniella lustricola TaxID=2025994 RepID=A0A2T3AKJ7_9PEZI|nr:phosphatidylinositol 3 and 4-kinase-domain-containing protein [Coniella lustricola]